MTGSSDKTLPRGTAVLVAVSGTDVGGPLADGFAQQGARVVLLTDRAADADSAVTQIETSFASRESVAAAFAMAQQRLGPVQVVVHSGIPAISLTSAPIESLSVDQWNEASHTAVKSTLYCMQAAHDHFDGRGGSIVVFGPALSLVGAPGLVALSTALEAQRTLVKSAARQWGPKGIRVNWVAIGAEGNYPALASADIPQVPELFPPPLPLGHVPNFRSDAAALIGLLGSDAARAITGATLNIDGGVWMVP
jgi:NAD(P)-dependent dehydrogenase (short-subunit alcohol dehydrogenase family)